MASLPRPLIALLVATVAALGLWYVELKPSSSSRGGSQGVGSYQSAINKAHQAVKTSGAANARLGAPTSTRPAASSPTPVKTATATKTATTGKIATAGKTTTTGKAAPATTKTVAAKPAGAAKPAAKAPSVAQQVQLVKSALASHKVIAVLFYNDAASDDRAMAHELRAVPTHNGQVIRLAVPLTELTSFAMITQQVPVVTAPTLVVIDGSRQATTITGYADPLAITEYVDDALAAK
ncbi:MAG TPA: hypothetical protein VGF93_17005 [Solirubrobacteraceae bacterium]|jgi:hypothetical protein